MSTNAGGIDWSSWEHAYGPATDVPGWIDRIGGPDPKAALAALRSFEAAVNHQGWVTPAAVPATPLLLGLLGERRGPVAALALLLGDLAAGGSHGHWLTSGFGPEDLPPKLRPMREAIAREVDLFLGLLQDKDAKVRAAATVPVGVLFECADVALPALRARLSKERAQEPLAGALLGLGLLHAAARVRNIPLPEGPDLDAVRPHFAHKSAIVQLAARVAEVQIAPRADAA